MKLEKSKLFKGETLEKKVARKRRRRSETVDSQMSNMQASEDYKPQKVSEEVERPAMMPDFDEELEAHSRPTSQPTNRARRFFKESKEIISDTWELEESKFVRRKDKSNPNNPDWELRKHKHFFRTFDSSGRKLTKSCAIGGHWHEVTTRVEEDGTLVAECGPAIYKNEKSESKMPKRYRRPEDGHTHVMRFLGSDLIKRRTISKEAQAYIAAINEYSSQKPLPKVEE